MRGAASDRAFLWISAALFVVSAGATVAWCESMSTMDGMTMSGGWTMSMAWMRMPEQTWLGAGASFTAMWTVMMVAMMTPSLVPMLRRYRAAIAPAGEPRLGRLTALAGLAYFGVWTAYGVAIYPIGVAVADAAMRWPELARAVPLGAGVVVAAAGGLQLTAWKVRCLGSCREVPGCESVRSADAADAWSHGVSLALHCGRCCANLMAVLLVLGVMDVTAMAAVTLAITAERVGPSGERAARVTGWAAVLVGLVLIVRAVSPSS